MAKRGRKKSGTNKRTAEQPPSAIASPVIPKKKSGSGNVPTTSPALGSLEPTDDALVPVLRLLRSSASSQVNIITII